MPAFWTDDRPRNAKAPSLRPGQHIFRCERATFFSGGDCRIRLQLADELDRYAVEFNRFFCQFRDGVMHYSNDRSFPLVGRHLRGR